MYQALLLSVRAKDQPGVCAAGMLKKWRAAEPSSIYTMVFEQTHALLLSVSEEMSVQGKVVTVMHRQWETIQASLGAKIWIVPTLNHGHTCCPVWRSHLGTIRKVIGREANVARHASRSQVICIPTCLPAYIR